ncbi:hypothetical protein VTL71DRAFT_8322 [Oculimacula yallundae]|uniref:Uncharacterized protein n=1 Tax=Oculimacula yallundae TaxID=86028 RepID=A0ABR4CXA1_9HELO
MVKKRAKSFHGASSMRDTSLDVAYLVSKSKQTTIEKKRARSYDGASSMRDTFGNNGKRARFDNFLVEADIGIEFLDLKDPTMCEDKKDQEAQDYDAIDGISRENSSTRTIAASSPRKILIPKRRLRSPNKTPLHNSMSPPSPQPSAAPFGQKVQIFEDETSSSLAQIPNRSLDASQTERSSHSAVDNRPRVASQDNPEANHSDKDLVHSIDGLEVGEDGRKLESAGRNKMQ